MGNGKQSVPDYPTTKQETGLFGTAVTGKGGTTFTPTPFQTQLTGMAEQQVPGLFAKAQQPISVNLQDPYFLNRQAQLKDLQGQMWNTQVVNPMFSQGLTRGSSANELANMFATQAGRQNLQEYQTEYERLAGERDRNLNLANQLMQWYTVPYEMQQGTAGLGQNFAQNVAKYNLDKQKYYDNSGLFGTLANNIGTIGAQKII